jgi:hypothetical protein
MPTLSRPLLTAGAALAASALLWLYLRRLPASSGGGPTTPAPAAAPPPVLHILLVDNGSLRASSYLVLRELASAVSALCGRPVTAASARFSDRIPPSALGGVPAETLASATARLLPGAGAPLPSPTHFLVLPAFLGPSDALRGLVPEHFAALAQAHGPSLTFSLARHLATPEEPRVAQALLASLQALLAQHALPPQAAAIALCDHGSPHPEVGAVRSQLHRQLGGLLAGALPPLRAPLAQASMERREGAQYDFNDPPLATLLRTPPYNQGVVLLALLFLAPGAHAGEGGDIDQIVQGAVAEAAEQGRSLVVHRTPCLGPSMAPVLADRLQEALQQLPLLHAQ